MSKLTHQRFGIKRLDLAPSVRRLPDGSRELLADFRYEDTEGPIIIRAGFVTDYSSVPHRLSWLMPPWFKLDLAGIVHDAFYRAPPFSKARRARADRAWWRVARAQGNSRYSAWKGHSGLRMFGWTSYGERNPHVKKGAA